MLLVYYAYLLWQILSGLQTIHATDTNEDTSTKSPYRNLAPNNADFAFNLFKYLTASNPNTDILISPISISMTLSMLSLGANGHTRIQMLKGLGFDIHEISETEIHQSFQHLHELLRWSDMNMGNTLFHNQNLKLMELFLADTKRYYGLENLPVDLQDWGRSSSQINEYIKDKTQEEISDLSLELESPATIFLINYVFFTGTWEQAFNARNTRLEDFYVDDTATVKVPMMFQSNIIKHLDDPKLSCRVVKLGYVGNSTTFLILPDRGHMDTVIQALSRDTIQRWSMSMASSHLDLYVPKLSLSGTYDLRDIMKAMNIADLQNNQTDLTGITGNAQWKLSKMMHKTKLRLNEKGKEPTTSPVSTLGGRQETVQSSTIQFNQPFLIMVFDNVSWSSLFLGRVVKPTLGHSHVEPS